MVGHIVAIMIIDNREILIISSKLIWDIFTSVLEYIQILRMIIEHSTPISIAHTRTTVLTRAIL